MAAVYSVSTQVQWISLTPNHEEAEELAEKFKLTLGGAYMWNSLGLTELNWRQVTSYLFNVDLANKNAPNYIATVKRALVRANGDVARPYDLVSNLAGAAYRLEVYTPDIRIKVPASLVPFLKGGESVCPPPPPEYVPPTVQKIEIKTENDAKTKIYPGDTVTITAILSKAPSYASASAMPVPRLTIGTGENGVSLNPVSEKIVMNKLALVTPVWQLNNATITFDTIIPSDLAAGDYSNASLTIGGTTFENGENMEFSLTITEKPKRTGGGTPPPPRTTFGTGKTDF